MKEKLLALVPTAEADEKPDSRTESPPSEPDGMPASTESLTWKGRKPARASLGSAPVSRSSSNTSPIADENLPQQKTCLAADALHLLVCAAVVLAASTILVQSSSSVFGTGWQAWAKAALLEVGIVGLSLCGANTISELLVARGGAVALGALSLTILHAGVKSDETRALTAAESSSEALQNLRDERESLRQILETLPAQHVTRREAVVTLLRENAAKTESAKERAAGSSAVQSIERTHLVEAFMRAALMFINVTFAHGLLRGVKRGRAQQLALEH